MTATTTNHPPQTDFWERWNWIWSALFYLTLAIPTTLVIGTLPSAAQGWVAGLALAASGWHWLWTGVLPRALSQNSTLLRRRPLFAAIYLTGAMGLWLPLITVDKIFYIHLSGLFSQLFVQTEIVGAMVGTAFLTAVIILQNNSQPLSLQDPSVWGPVLGVAGANLFGLWLNGIIRESYERRTLLQELRQAQTDLAASERHAGVLSERQRLAHEIHDTLAQGFIGIIMHLEAAQSLPPEQATQHVAQAEQLARQNLQQARYLVEDLHPLPTSLPDAIRQTVAEWQGKNQTVVHVEVTGEERPLPPHANHTLLRVTQEALANIHKHAQATEVTLTLSYMNTCLMLDIQDNGIGLHRSHSPWQGGFGLTAMRQRVEQLGGTLLLESEDSEGTTVVVSIPVIGNQ